MGSTLVGALSVACEPGGDPMEMPPPEEGPVASAVTVDGIPVDCTRLTTRALETRTARVVIAPAAGVEFEVTLGGSDVSDEFSAADPLEATLEVPTDRQLELRVAHLGADAWVCRTRLVFREAAERSLAELEASSDSPLIISRSAQTGAVSNAVLEVPTEGETASERAHAFLAAYAEAFAVPAWQLRERDRWEATDGWTSVTFEQWLSDDVRGLDASLEIELDDEGKVRTVHANLYTDLPEAPPFALGPGAATAIGERELTEIDEAQRIVYDLLDPRAGWHMRGLLGELLIDDEAGEVVWHQPPFHEAPMELHHPVPNPLTDTTRGVPSRRRHAQGRSSAGAPSILDGPERQLWSTTATIANQMRADTGNAGWPGGTIHIVTQAAVAEGMLTLPDGPTVRAPGAFYQQGHRHMFLDGAARARPDTICHEYGHAYDDFRGGIGTHITFTETLGDLFFLFCQPWANPRATPYTYNGGGRRHDSPIVRADQLNYDSFLRHGIRETQIGRGATIDGQPIGQHDHAFLVTHAFYQMMERYRLDRRKARELGFDAAAGNYNTYPEMRDRILSNAVSWSRSGRYGFSAADACAVAEGFRHTQLDGEYGTGAGCQRASRTELICTSRHCPLCDRPESTSVCTAESLAPGQPVCMTADRRRTCAFSTAPSGEGCPAGQARFCWCNASGSWDCSSAGACQPLARDGDFCPEEASPSGGGGGAVPTVTCAARPTGPSLPAFALILVMAGLALGARRRRRQR